MDVFKSSNEPLFQIADYMVFVFVIVGSLGIGVYYACANKTTDEYFLGNRQLRVIPVGVSLLVSYLSAITIMGKPAEIFYFGVELWFVTIGFMVGALLTCFTFVPLYHPLKLTSVNEYLQMRYKKKWITYVGCLIQVITSIAVGGVLLYGPATMLEHFAGVPVWASMLATSQIATVYTSLGGFKAVIWSDVFQAVGILVGLLAVVILGCMQVGTLMEVFEVYTSEGRGHLRMDVSLTVRSTVWGYIFGSGLGAMSIFGVAQPSVQRYSAMPTVWAAQKTLLVALPGNVVLGSLACLSGVVAFAYYTKLGCDPFRAGVMSNTNQIIPQFIKDVLRYPALPGIFAACIFCGTVSSLSSAYNGCSALIWNDVLREPLHKYRLQETRKSLITKVITVLIGLLSTASGFVVAAMGGTLIQMVVVVTGVLKTPLCALIFLGAISPKTSWKSASLAAFLSFLFVLYMSVGGVMYGSNKQPLPTVTRNCSALLRAGYTGHWNVTSTAYMEAVDWTSTARVEAADWTTTARVEAAAWTSTARMDAADWMKFGVSDPPGPLTTENFGDDDVPDADPEAFFVFRISHIWYFPLGFLVANVLGITFLYIPGLTESEYVEPKLLFPFIRRWLKNGGYELYEATKNGYFVQPAHHQEEKLKDPVLLENGDGLKT